MMTSPAQMLYMMLALPALFGLTLVGEGVYKMSHYQSGWFNVTLGALFLSVVAAGFFYFSGFVK